MDSNTITVCEERDGELKVTWCGGREGGREDGWEGGREEGRREKGEEERRERGEKIWVKKFK